VVEIGNNRGDNMLVSVRASVDVLQKHGKVCHAPKIRVWDGNGTYKEFDSFFEAIEFSANTEGAESPVIAFKGWEIDLYSIRQARFTDSDNYRKDT